MQLFVRDKNFYRRLVAVALPIAVQNLVNFGVSMADTVMLGMLGEVQLSAGSLGNQLGFIYMLIAFGVGSGSSVLIAQYWGNNDVKSIHRVMAMMYRIMLVAALIFTAIAVFFPVAVISIFTTDQAVIDEGSRYLRLIGMGYFFAGFTAVTASALRCVGAVKIPMIIYLSSLATNITLNYIFIFGKLGFPAMGVEGAAIATFCARTVEVIIVLVYMIFFEKRISLKLRHIFAKKLHIVAVFFKTAFPVVINEIIWSVGISTIAVIIGRMGTEFVAANSICNVVSLLASIAIYGSGNAAAVIIGNTVGEGDYERAKQYSRTFMALSIGLGLFSSALIMIIKKPMLSFYNVSPTTYLYADQLISILAIIIVFQSFAMISMVGVLRGGGDTRFVLLFDIIFMWGISIPLGYITGFHLGWAPAAVYAIIKSDEILKCTTAFIRITRGNWIKDVTNKA